MRHLQAVAFLAILLSAAACRSTPQPTSDETLPFLVAMMPIELQKGRVPNEDVKGATKMRVNPDMSELSRRVAEALSEDSFTHVILLDGEGVQDIEDQTERERAWIQAANEVGADLLLECGLDLNPVVRHHRNDNQWYNYPLFFLGGPFTWWVPDNTYSVDVQLSGSFYDLQALPQLDQQVDNYLGGRTGRVTLASGDFEPADVSFWSRADSVGDWGLSFIWFSTHLAKESDEFRDELVERVVTELSDGFARDVQLKRDKFIQSDTAGFYLDTDNASVTRDAAGRVWLRGSVYRSADSSELRSLRLAVVGESDSIDFQEGQKITRGEWQGWSYPVEASIQAKPTDKVLSVDIELDERDAPLRTYTFWIPESDS